MKLEDRIDMGLFGFGNKSKGIAEQFDENMDARKGVEDPSKRELLKKSIKVGAVAMAPGLIIPETAKASNDWVKKLPPGFQHHLLEDEGLRQIQARMMGFVSWTTRKEEVRTILTLSGWYHGYESIKRETVTKDPAYWFAIDYYAYVYNHDSRHGGITDRDMPITMDKLKSQNLPLYYFASGNQHYFMTWVLPRPRSNSKEVEENLLKSIFTAAGKSEAEVDAYLQLDMTGKERVLLDVMGRFRQIGARMKRAGEEARRRKTETERRNADELATLDREVFILERRLEREELSYEREYELTRELETKQQRLQTLRNASVTLDTSAEKAEYNRLLVAAWSSFLLTVNYRKVERVNKSDISGDYAQIMNQNIEVPIRNYVSKIRGPPHYPSI